jgi:hypothetical protein
VKNYIKQILREELLQFEGFDKVKDKQYQNIPVRRVKNTKTYITYGFKLGGLNYYVDIFTTKNKSMPDGTYEVLYGFEGQKSSYDTTKKGGFQHTKSVLYTVAKIMDKECKEKKIKYYHFEGFPNEKEQDINSDTTKRSRIYNTFFSMYYGADALVVRGRYTTILMNEVFPEYFETPTGKERKDHHLLGQFLRYINNDNPSYNVWNEIQVNGNEYQIQTSEIVTKNYGRLAVDIYCNEDESKFTISYNKIDVGEKESNNFNDFTSLFAYMQEKLIGKNG